MSLTDEEVESVENAFPDIYDEVEEIIKLEKKLTNLSIQWSKKVLKLKNELSDEKFDELESARSMLVDFDEEYQRKKEELSKLQFEVESLANGSKDRSEEQE